MYNQYNQPPGYQQPPHGNYQTNPPGNGQQYPPPGNFQQPGPPGVNVMSGPPSGGNIMGGPPPAANVMSGPPSGGNMMSGPPPGGNMMSGRPPAGNMMSGPPSGGNMMGGPPPAGNIVTGPPSSGPPTGQMGGPPGGYMSGPPSGGPPSGYMGGPPSGGPPGSSQPPAPKSNVQFFSVGGGGSAPVPTPSSNNMMPPPPSQQQQQGGNFFSPPPPGSGGADFQQMGSQYQLQSGQGIDNQQSGFPHAGSFGSNLAGMGGVQSSIDAGSNAYGVPGQSSMQQTGSGMALQHGQPDPNAVAQQLPSIEDMDLSIQCDQRFLRSSVSKVIYSQGIAQQCRFPLGIVCQPMAGEDETENSEVEVVDFGSTGIVRCKRCRTYINPFVSWVDNGRRWRCNICGMLNDVPTSYFSHLDQQGQRRDKDQRPELNRCSVEFIAPADYMVRPPQPPVFFFVIDVTSAAGSSGMLTSCVNAIRDSLDVLPGNPRTQIGFITFDTSVHFYNLKSSLKAPQMLVVSDITDVIMPSPEDLLVNLQDSRDVVEALLDSLPSMFQNNIAMNSCTGAAIMAAKRVIQNIGGKMLLFQTSLPSIGEGILKPRENPRLLGTDKEHILLNPEEVWYKNNAVEFSRLQICCDIFLFSNQYTDVATFAVLSKYTSGSTYYYPNFYGPRDGTKFETELTRCLTRATAFEAVMRVRATRGMRISNFYGNFFIRGADLLALPNCHSDSVYAMDLAYDETVLNTTAVTIQAALLYTNTRGERRIRVHTMVMPVTQSTTDMLSSADIDCAVNVCIKQAIDIAVKTGLDNARQRIHQTCVEVLRAAQGGGSPQQAHSGYGHHQQQQHNPSSDGKVMDSLQLLPLYAMSMQKNLAIRGGTDVRTDERAFVQTLLMNMGIEDSKVFIYPRMFSIHDMAIDAGTYSDNVDDDVPTAGSERVRLPAILNLSHERLTSEGIFLLENGYDLFMWIGRNVSPAIIDTLFGVNTLEGVNLSTLEIQSESSDYSSRLNTIIRALREERPRHLQLHFIREGDGHAEAFFSRFLVEDRADRKSVV